MLLKDFLSVFDTNADIVIWHKDDEDSPVYKGSIFDVPFGWLDATVIKPKDEYDGGYISQDLDKGTKIPEFNHRAGLVIMIEG